MKESAKHAEARPTPVKALNDFLEFLRESGERPPGRRLVLLASSGGGHRATFWTAMVLDKLMEMSRSRQAAGLARHIRLITGASGGMVGAAYLATLTPQQIASGASIEQLIKDDISKAQEERAKTEVPLPGDSLSQVLQQLVMRDFFHLAFPFTSTTDRGEVLQSNWGSLEKTFREVASQSGAAPSLIFSPVIAETGQPLLISDLDLSGWESKEPIAVQHTWEFFKVFPEAFGKLTLQTAARMSATFPAVSPAVALPTEPLRRVVDAGYYDNYGMATALAYLRQETIIKWLGDNGFDGVLIIQVNAFPVLRIYDWQAGCRDDQPKDSLPYINWLTMPLEGAEAARSRAMVFRSEQELQALQRIYQSRELKLVRVPFENTARSSFSWYLPRKDMECMASELKDAPHVHAAFDEVKAFWNAPSRTR